MKFIKFCLLLFCLIYVVSCGKINVTNSSRDNNSQFFNGQTSNLTEVAVPKIIRELNLQLEQYSPQVQILSPRMGQTIDKTNVNIALEVKDLPIFQDDKLKLGNHLNLIVDNEPSRQIYDLEQKIPLENLTPGTHTIRVFATRPWGESFKNDGAYAQTTFNVLTETNDNRPDVHVPLLTYGSPTGNYSAEPFLLDFYLTNAPLHSVAQNDPNLADWKIKTTINGESFFLENWQPVYLTGLNKGKNWIQLELLDEAGNNIENAFNNTVRVINYEPGQIDTLGKLFTDRLSLAEAQPIVEQSYYIQPVGEPEIIEPTVELEEEIIESEGIKSAIESPAEEENTSENITTSDLKLDSEDDVEIVTEAESELETPEISTPPEVNSVAETKTIEETAETNEDKEIANSSKNSLIVEENGQESDKESTEENPGLDESILTMEEPEVESEEITNQTISDSELSNVDVVEPESTAEKPKWFKKLLVGLRQKLESLIRLLPQEY